jgi:hypothetical protein
MNDRRISMREPVFAPTNINTEERRDRVGVIREMSSSGALFHSRSRFAVGERLAMTYRTKRGNFAQAEATVVRAFRDSCDDNIFPFLTAVCFKAEAELPMNPDHVSVAGGQK